MELKEYLKIIRKQKPLFFGVIFGVIISSFAYFYLRPVSYGASLALNITRTGGQQTDNYKYDDFYRLQADEKFAETVVGWLKNPRVVADIYSDAGVDGDKLTLRQLTKVFRSEKMSSQLVSVYFSSPDEKTAQRIAVSVSKIISKSTQELNREQKEAAWFSVLSADPVIVKNAPRPLWILVGSLLAGIFLAFWSVMLTHYLRED